MGVSLKERIVEAVIDSREESLRDKASERDVAAFQHMMDTLFTEDYMGFHYALQDQLDRPEFDRLLQETCRANPHFAGFLFREALRGSSTISNVDPSTGAETITDVFFFPVTGSRSDIERMLGDGKAMSAIENAFMESGLVSPYASVHVADMAILPDVAVHARPGEHRRLTKAFEDYWTAGETPAARLRTQESIREFERSCHSGSQGQVAAGNESVTVLLAASYRRVITPHESAELDGLMAQVAGSGYANEFEDQLEEFELLAEDDTGLRIGRPHLLGRACAAAGVQSIMVALDTEANFFGTDIRSAGLDGVAVAYRDGFCVVEGEVDGNILGPYAFPAQIASHEPDWPEQSLSSISRTMKPSGHLEHGVSARLN